MEDIKFPVRFTVPYFDITNDFTSEDSLGITLAYVRQKMFKLKEDVLVYGDKSKSSVAYRIKADRWIDFSAAYSMKDNECRRT